MRRHLFNLASPTLVLLCLALCGCSQEGSYYYPVQESEPLRGYIALADRRAQQVLADWNASPKAVLHWQFVHEPPTTLTLSDYHHTLQMVCHVERDPPPGGPRHRPVLSVHYSLSAEVGGVHVLGFPSYFFIDVYMDNNQTEYLGG